MVNIDIFERGTQVLYVPRHAHGDLNHPDVEEGFVTSARRVGEVALVWCRFWSKEDPTLLRTLSCSERCNPNDLFVKNTRPQCVVDSWIAELYGGDDAK